MEQRIGRLVRDAREARDWTQEDLANAAGVRTITVSRVERGVQAPKAATLRRLARALDLPAQTLLDASDGGPAHQRQLLEELAATVAKLAEGQAALLAGQNEIVSSLSRLEAATVTSSTARKDTRA